MHHDSDHDYSFSGKLDTQSKVYEAWRTAMDVRKFEIELYWKRAAYFWTFIGLALAAYGAILTSIKDLPLSGHQSDALFTIALIGLVFSVAWYFVNRGSKYWQQNWEYQVDILEDEALGSIYKTVFFKSKPSFKSFMHLTGPYSFSVTKINIILSLFVVCLFFLLSLYALPCIGFSGGCWPFATTKVVIATLTGVFIALLLFFGRTSENNISEPKFSVRQASTANLIVPSLRPTRRFRR